MLGWFRRRRYLKRPIPPEWTHFLMEDVPFFRRFSATQRERFLDRLKVFVWEKAWIEAGGMVIDERVQVVIAAAAVRLALELSEDVYDRLTEIVVYPGHYTHPDKEEGHVVYGEAHNWGTVVLSWDAVLTGLANPRDGHDTATHEFAHVLDRANGAFNGTPNLRAREHYRAWASVLSHHFAELREGRRPESKVLDDYGATNEPEFFAVATESFFEKAKQMRKHLPDLYDELRRFYGVDPAEEE